MHDHGLAAMRVPPPCSDDRAMELPVMRAALTARAAEADLARRLHERLAGLPFCDVGEALGPRAWRQGMVRLGLSRRRHTVAPPPFLQRLLEQVTAGGWGIGHDSVGVLAQVFAAVKPSLVLEFGSGTSTVVLAALAEAQGGSSRVVSLDERDDFAARTRGHLQRLGLSRRATVVVAPVEQRRVGDWQGWCYHPQPSALTRALAGGRADLVFVDGPATWLKRRGDCRFGALLMAHECAGPQAVVIADDAFRRRDRANLHRWATRAGAALLGIVAVDHGLGIAALRPDSTYVSAS